MKLTTSRHLPSAIKGFNREWAAITSIWDHSQPRNKLGYKLTTACGTERKFLDPYFTDTHAAAVMALESHRCPLPQ